MFKRAFTMIELIFVIVIIGILSKFGIEILFNAYENYVLSATQSKLQSQSESAVTQIAARLQYRLKNSTIVRSPLGAPIALQNAVGNERVLEWVGMDIEGWRGSSLGSTNPNWSGFIDYLPSDVSKTLVSPGTNTATESALIKVLSNNKADLNTSVIAFIGNTNVDIQRGYGWDGAVFNNDQNRSLHPIDFAANPNEFAPHGTFVGMKMFEYYQLAWTAYAISHDANNNLWLHYNYRPWRGESYLNAPKQLLMQNAESFGYIDLRSMIKIQVCVTDGDTFKEGAYSICKEKTIF